jgi:beta-lactamase regulating signal transducer with metallopeptidase domain
MATFMMFGLLAGALVAAACALLESALLGAKRPVRWVWLGGMVGTVLLVALSAARTSSRTSPNDANARTATIMPANNQTLDLPTERHRRADGARPLAPTATFDRNDDSTRAPLVQPLMQSLTNPATAWIGAHVEQLRTKTAVADRPLSALWAASSVVLAVWLLASLLQTPTGGASPEQGQRRVPMDDASSARPHVSSVIVTDGVGPAAVGLWRGRILMPRWVLELEPTLYTLILQHEREHLRTRDPLVRALALFMIVLLPWQIPLWSMARRLRLAMEFDCDARVLRFAPDVRRYASLLMLVSANRGSSRSTSKLLTPLVYMSTASTRSSLRQRILVMTQPCTPTRAFTPWASVTAAALLTLAAIMLPIPPHAVFAQRPSTAARATPTSTLAERDSVVIVRYILGSVTYIGGQGKKSFAYFLQNATPFDDPNAGFTTINVTSVSGKRTEVALFVEREVGDRTLPSDTSLTRTPFSLVRRNNPPTFHLRAVNGDSLLVTSPAAVSPTWATKIRGVHFIFWGVNKFGIVQQ